MEQKTHSLAWEIIARQKAYIKRLTTALILTICLIIMLSTYIIFDICTYNISQQPHEVTEEDIFIGH